MTEMTDQKEQQLLRALLRALPGMDRLLQTPAAAAMATQYGRDLTITALRQSLERVRLDILHGRTDTPPPPALLVEEALGWLHALLAPTLQPVINATGVIVHTNLGRAPLSQAALQAIQEVGQGYSTLEYDIVAGARGSRTEHAAQLLRDLTGAEAALVVNNNAAALLLLLTALCRGREVIISRGQLVEIGGGFRIPDVMAQSGAKLVEVGATNRTHLHDYERAINEQTAALLVAHHSNYKIVGFTGEPSLTALAEVARAHHLPLLYDQGSGALLDTAPYGLDPEPTVPAGLQAGCDVVAFSGDKLLGGPQAGILVGRSELINRCKQHPLARAVRADKLCLAALAATLTHYLAGQAETHIPVWRQIARSPADIETEAMRWQQRLQQHNVATTIVDGRSTIGGGSLPGATLPTKVVAISTDNVEELAARLRAQKPALIGRIQDGRFLLDPRTVLPEQVDDLIQSLVNCAL